MNVKSRKGNQGSALVFSVVVVMLVTALITALLSLNKLEMNKSIRATSKYQLELSAQSYIDMVVVGLNGNGNTSLTIPTTAQSVDISIVPENNRLDTLVKAQLVRDDQDFVYILVECTNNSNQSVTMRGYVEKKKNANNQDVYEVSYYELP